MMALVWFLKLQLFSPTQSLGIPVEMNTQYSVYIPEMIFGDLLTGSNFDDSQMNTVAGRNGLGRFHSIPFCCFVSQM
jgi:hypothetical protein